MSADSLNYCANSGLISDLLGELTGEDVLVRYVVTLSCSLLCTSLGCFVPNRSVVLRSLCAQV